MFYLELVAKCKFDSTKAWKLVDVCVAAIFEAAQPFRAKVILLEDSTKVNQKASFMWAIFQTHRVIQSFIGVQFKSHPAIVKEISLFMVTERVDSKEILDLGLKCKKAEAEATKAVGDVKKLTESHNELKQKHDALLADFKLVKAKVNKGRWELGAPPPKRARAAGPQAAVASLPTRGRITLRGLTSGDIGLEGSGSKSRCILVGDKFCAWLPHIGFLGLKIVGVLLQSDSLLGLLDQKFGNDCDIQIGQWEAANMHADILLVDRPASPEVLQVASQSHAKLVLITTRENAATLCQTLVGSSCLANESRIPP
jgi:hypothetical protein